MQTLCELTSNRKSVTLSPAPAGFCSIEGLVFGQSGPMEVVSTGAALRQRPAVELDAKAKGSYQSAASAWLPAAGVSPRLKTVQACPGMLYGACQNADFIV